MRHASELDHLSATERSAAQRMREALELFEDGVEMKTCCSAGWPARTTRGGALRPDNAPRAIDGTSLADRVENLSFCGITFENTDYNLYEVDGSRRKASVQGATVCKAYGDGNWHDTRYEILGTFPGVTLVNSASGIEITDSVVKHSGSEGISTRAVCTTAA